MLRLVKPAGGFRGGNCGLEPMMMHLGKESGMDRRGTLRQNGVDAASRAKRRVVVVRPFPDFRRVVCLFAIKTTGAGASRQVRSVVHAMHMGGLNIRNDHNTSTVMMLPEISSTTTVTFPSTNHSVPGAVPVEAG